jgi:hypothetical protein
LQQALPNPPDNNIDFLPPALRFCIQYINGQHIQRRNFISGCPQNINSNHEFIVMAWINRDIPAWIAPFDRFDDVCNSVEKRLK